MRKQQTYIDEGLERWIDDHFVVNPIGRNWIVRDVLHVCVSELQGSVEHGRSDASNDWMLLPLDLMELFDQFTMVIRELLEIMENLSYEHV